MSVVSNKLMNFENILLIHLFPLTYLTRCCTICYSTNIWYVKFMKTMALDIEGTFVDDVAKRNMLFDNIEVIEKFIAEARFDDIVIFSNAIDDGQQHIARTLFNQCFPSYKHLLSEVITVQQQVGLCKKVSRIFVADDRDWFDIGFSNKNYAMMMYGHEMFKEYKHIVLVDDSFNPMRLYINGKVFETVKIRDGVLQFV